MSSAQESEDQSKKITFKFCRECSNMLYPAEDRENSQLIYSCRTCQYAENATSACVYRNDLSNTVGDTAGITQDIGQDPTVCAPASAPSAPFFDFCTVCGNEIICEDCGNPTVAACWLEVNENESDTIAMESESESIYMSDPSSEDFNDNDDNDEDAFELAQIKEFVNSNFSNLLKPTSPPSTNSQEAQHLPRINKPCPQCNENEAVFFQSQQRTAETGMKLYYVCVHCGHVWQ